MKAYMLQYNYKQCELFMDRRYLNLVLLPQYPVQDFNQPCACSVRHSKTALLREVEGETEVADLHLSILMNKGFQVWK